MEISVFPRGFTVQQGSSPLIQGGETPTMTVVVQDVGGDTFKIVFALQDWEAFQRCCADPEGFRAAAEARSRLIVPPGGRMAVPKERKH